MADIDIGKGHTWAFLASSHLFQDIHISNFMTLQIQIKVMMYIVCSGVIRWQLPGFLSDGNSNGWIFPADTCKKTFEKFDLEHLGQG